MKSSRIMILAAVVVLTVGSATAVGPNAFECEPRQKDIRSHGTHSAHVSERGIPQCAATSCTTAISGHIKHELDAAFDYLYLAAFFDDGQRARPGLAKFLYESSSEEREHAAMMLAYMDRRGVPYAHTAYSYTPSANLKTLVEPQVLSYASVLDFALTREMEVTSKIHSVIQLCENDYDAADYFTQPIIAEQHEGMRKLRGAISSFNDLLLGTQQHLAEFIFDQRILKGGL